MESHVGAYLYVAVPVAAVAEPGSDEYLVVVDHHPDRGAFGPAVLSDSLYIDLDLAVEESERLSVERGRLRLPVQ